MLCTALETEYSLWTRAQLGGSIRTLVTIHAVRIVMVVFTVPFLMQIILGRDLSRVTGLAVAASDAQLLDWSILAACGVAGYFAAKRFNLPGGVLVASMVFSAGVHATGLTQVLPPFWLVALVQVIVGSIAGSRFAGITWGEIKASMAQAVVWGIVLLATACGIAALGAHVFGRPFAALMLSMSPGGMQEMIIISYALGIETAFVIACHVCRSSFVLTFAPVLFRRLGVGGIPSTRSPSTPGDGSQS